MIKTGLWGPRDIIRSAVSHLQNPWLNTSYCTFRPMFAHLLKGRYRSTWDPTGDQCFFPFHLNFVLVLWDEYNLAAVLLVVAGLREVIRFAPNLNNPAPSWPWLCDTSTPTITQLVIREMLPTLLPLPISESNCEHLTLPCKAARAQAWKVTQHLRIAPCSDPEPLEFHSPSRRGDYVISYLELLLFITEN